MFAETANIDSRLSFADQGKQTFVEILQSHCIHTVFYWSSGPPVCFLSRRTRNQSLGGYFCETGILLLALSRYIGDPVVIDHCGLIWGRLRPEPSQGCRVHNVIILLDLRHSSSVPVSRSLEVLLPASQPTRSAAGGGALWRASNLTAFIHSSTGPAVYPFASRHEGPRFNPQGGVLMWNRDSPVSIVLLHICFPYIYTVYWNRLIYIDISINIETYIYIYIYTVGAKSLEQREKFRAILKPFSSENQ
jgi:hypothetical protein